MQRIARQTWQACAAGASAALLGLAGCGGDDAGDATTAAAAATEAVAATEAAAAGSGGEVSIAVNPWTGSAANANVASILLEGELGYTVELVEIDEFAQFPALGVGDLDATLEV